MTTYDNVFKTALELEKIGRYEDAYEKYVTGLGLLSQHSRSAADKNLKSFLQRKLNQYLTHTENLKKIIDQDKNSKNNVNVPPAGGLSMPRNQSQTINSPNLLDTKTITIEENQTGVTFENLFSDYLTNVDRAILTDPYLCKPHQLRNLQSLCTLFYEKGLKFLIIETQPDTASDPEFKEFMKIFNQYIKITTISSQSIHDREIILYNKFNPRTDNEISGFRIRLGRGLDIYKNHEGKYSLGSNGDFRHRKCRQTSIDFMKKAFSRAEYDQELGMIKEIKTAFTNCQKISTDNSKPPQYKTGFYNTQIEKLDSLVLPSTFKYAKAHKKEVINKIEAL